MSGTHLSGNTAMKRFYCPKCDKQRSKVVDQPCQSCVDHETWLSQSSIDDLVKWLEECTLSELTLAKDFIETHRANNSVLT